MSLAHNHVFNPVAMVKMYQELYQEQKSRMADETVNNRGKRAGTSPHLRASFGALNSADISTWRSIEMQYFPTVSFIALQTD